MKKIILLNLILSSAYAADVLETIEVVKQDSASVWKEEEETKILTGKKNRSSKVNYLPPVQTDNNRQHFSQHASIYAPEQSTEPWTALSFRGIGDPHEAQNILIMQDGLPVAVDMYGQPGNYYAPPAPLMEEIQVIAGGGALMYGPQPGGAINYQSPKLTKGMPTHGRLNLAAGSYSLFSTVNSVTGSQGNTSFFAGYYRKQGEGYQHENADFFSDYLQLKTNTYLENNTMFKFSLQGFDSDYGMPGGMSLNDGNNLNNWKSDPREATREFDRLKISRGQVMVGLEKKLSSATYLDTQIWGTAYRRYSKTQSGSGFGVIPTANANSIRDVQSFGFNGEVRLKHEWERWENKHSLSTGYLSYNTNSPSVTEAGTANSNNGQVTSRSSRTTRTQAVFAENRFAFGKLAVVPGVRFENITLSNETLTKSTNSTAKQSETYNVILGGLGLSYFLTDNTQAFANVSQGFKPVSFSDVLNQGNPTYTVQGDIEPSYNYFYEAGLRGETDKLNWDASLYHIYRQNIISTSGSVLSNGRSAKYQGAKASLTFKDVLAGRAPHNVDLYLNGNFNNAEYQRGSLKGKTPAYVPSLLLKYGMIFRHADVLKVSLLGNFVNEHYADDTHSDDFKVPSYTLFDVLGEYQLNQRWSVNGAINNLLDRQYYARVMATGVLPNMGRNFYAGVNYRF